MSKFPFHFWCFVEAIDGNQKMLWKRPSSAADSERRLPETRRSTGGISQVLSGSDGEQDCR